MFSAGRLFGLVLQGLFLYQQASSQFIGTSFALSIVLNKQTLIADLSFAGRIFYALPNNIGPD